MGVQLFLFMASCFGVFVAWMTQSPELLMVAGPAAIASLWIWLRALLVPPINKRFPAETPALTRVQPKRTVVRRRRGILRPKVLRHIVVDGSNVMHWKDNTPKLETLQEVLRALEQRGYSPGVVFDANAGYLLTGSYAHDYRLGKQLGLPKDRVMVVDKGVVADTIILAAARDLGVSIVSQDRFRDHATEFPEVSDPAHFLRGGYDKGALWLQPDVVAAQT